MPPCCPLFFGLFTAERLACSAISRHCRYSPVFAFQNWGSRTVGLPFTFGGVVFV
jgi:hypothetical protein